jgi:4,5-DOPA dioxygenase extradiol
MPVAFIGHGSPLNAIEPNEFHLGWRKLAQDIPQPDSILCISAHWETSGLFVTSSHEPPTIHDFYGFPRALFEVQYPAPGSPALAHRTANLLAPDIVTLDSRRGLDHGAWGVLAAMYPNANIPIVQLSLDSRLPGDRHYEIARRLAPLRDEGVLILGSGDIVHNLKLFNFHDATPASWAVKFNDRVKDLILAREHQQLIDYKLLGKDVGLAIPSPEHFLPLLYALALQADGDAAHIFTDVVTSSISMTSVLISGA